MRLLKRSIWIALWLVATVFAQSYESGTVVKWETKAFAMTAVHPAGNRVVYSIKVGEITYQVARRSAKVEMTKGAQVQCRVEKNQLIIRNDQNKEVKYDIVGTD